MKRARAGALKGRWVQWMARLVPLLLIFGAAPVRAEVMTLSCTWLGGNGWMDMTIDVDLGRSTIELVAPLRWNRAEPAQIDSRFIVSGKIRIDRRTGMIEWGIAGDPPGKCKPAPPGF